MALTCGNFAGKSRCYALIVLFTLVQRAVVAHHCSHKKEKEELVALARDLGLLRDATTFPHRRELPARGGFRSACSPEFARIVFHESARSRNISRGTSVLHGGYP